METHARVLGALRDLRGVEGSFYADREGVILGRDMPRIYDGDDLADVATRMSRFLDALVDLDGTNEGVMIRHPHHTIFLRGTDDGFLGVLATADVNVPALKRGASLVLRRLPNARSEGAAADPSSMSALGSIGSSKDAAPSVPSATRVAPDPPPLPPEARRAAPPPLPEPSRDSHPSFTPGAVAVPRPRVSVPGAPAPRQSTPGAPAIRYRGSVKDS